MSHSCIDHGHACYECERHLEEKEDRKLNEQEVKNWAWNLNIFEIYDEIRGYDEDRQRDLLRFAINHFNTKDSKAQLIELAFHLDVDVEGCDDGLHDDCDHACEIYNCAWAA